MKRLTSGLLCIVLAALAGCSKPPPPPPASPTANLAKRFEERLGSAEEFPEAEALAFVRVLGPAAAPVLGRQPISTDASRRRLLAKLLASAAQAGIRDAGTFAAALGLSTDADAETRWAAREALLWSRRDWDPAPDVWPKNDADAKSFGIDREYAIPRFDLALSWIQRDIAASATDTRILPRYHGPMGFVKGSLGVNACDSLQVPPEEKLWWVIQSARAGDTRSIQQLDLYLEPEPNVGLGRTPTEKEVRLASMGLRSSPGGLKGR